MKIKKKVEGFLDFLHGIKIDFLQGFNLCYR